MALVDWETQDKLKRQEAIIDDLRGKLAAAEEKLVGKGVQITEEQHRILSEHLASHGTSKARQLAGLMGVGTTTAHRWLKAAQEGRE